MLHTSFLSPEDRLLVQYAVKDGYDLENPFFNKSIREGDFFLHPDVITSEMRIRDSFRMVSLQEFIRTNAFYYGLKDCLVEKRKENPYSNDNIFSQKRADEYYFGWETGNAHQEQFEKRYGRLKLMTVRSIIEVFSPRKDFN